MNDRYPHAPCLGLDRESASRDRTVCPRAMRCVPPTPSPAPGMTSRAGLRRSSSRPPGRSPAGPWLGILAAGADLFGMAEPDGHALLAEMAAGLVAACPGVRALAPAEGAADITVTLATEAGRLVTFAPFLVTDRETLARLETDVLPDAALPAPVLRLPVE